MNANRVLKKIVISTIALFLSLSVLPLRIYAEEENQVEEITQETETIVEETIEEAPAVEEVVQEVVQEETPSVEEPQVQAQEVVQEVVEATPQEVVEEVAVVEPITEVVEEVQATEVLNEVVQEEVSAEVPQETEVQVDQKEDEQEAEVIEEDTEAKEETEEETEDKEVDRNKQFKYRLIVGFYGAISAREDDVLLGDYGNVALFGFDDAAKLNEAKAYYAANAMFASVDGTLSASANSSSGVNIDTPASSAKDSASMEDNPLSAASETYAVAVGANSSIALVDTGASAANVVSQLSVLGGAVYDDNGHGSMLANVIASENPNAKVVSIKALDASGKGTVASVYAAIKLAINSNVGIILCPFSSLGYSEAIRSVIREATNRGIKVVVSAGNDAQSSLNYCPANVAEAITVGALNSDKEVASFSNYGDNIDAWIEADSTSVASAKIAAAISSGKQIDEFQIGAEGEDDEDLEFETNYKTTTDDIVDGGVYIIRLRKDPKRSLVQQTAGFSNGNKFVLSNGEKREDSGAQFSVKKINYNFYLRCRDNTNYIMSPDGGSSGLGTNGQKVHMWYKTSSNYGDYDQWWMKRNGNYYRITNGANTGMHLQTEGSATDGNTTCHLWNATSGTQGDWIFERVHYYVAFNGNGNTGGSMSSQKIWQEVNTALTANGFTKTGYTFNGWNTNSSGTGTNYSNQQSVKCLTTTNAATINLYAKWKANTYTVAYNGNGATSGSMSNSSHTYDAAKNLTSNAYSRTGYTFNGWNTKSDGTGTSYANGASVKNLGTSGTVTLYAQWKPNTYTVAYNGNGSTSGSTASSSHSYGTAKTLTANGFVKTGYYFDSWNTKEDASGTKYSDKASVSNLTATDKATVTLYAQWKPNTYTVVYNGNGSTGGTTDSSTHTYDTAKLLTANGYVRTGYTFKGWNSTAQGTGTDYEDKQSVKNLTTTKDAEFNLYAKWTANDYVLALESLEATNPGTANVYYTFDTNKYFSDSEHNTEVSTITIPEKNGYTFGGYYSARNGGGTEYIDAEGAFVNDPYKIEGTTLYAKWIPNTYTVTFDPNGGVLADGTTSPFTATYDEAFTIHHPTYEGYTFKGWNIVNMEEGINHELGTNTSTDTTAENISATHFKNLRANTGTVAFVANWQANTYTVRFDGNGGELHESTENPLIATYDDEAFTVKAPTRDGYVFHGWKITGMEGSSHIINDQTISDASYTLETEADAEVTFKNLRAVKGEVEITAIWAEDVYTAKYLLNGGTIEGIENESVHEYEYNHTFSLVNPERPGYTFIGWTITGMNAGSKHLVGGEEITDAEIAGVTGTSFGRLNMHGDCVTFEARWDSNDISVILTAPEANENSNHLRRIYYTFDEEGYFTDEAHTTPLDGAITTPVRDNYEFTGYYESSDASGEASIYADGTIHDTLYNKYPTPHNLYAGWNPNTYAITLSQNDATTKGTETIYEKYNTGIYTDEEATTELNTITIPSKEVTVSFDVDTDEISAPANQKANLQFDGYYDGDKQLIGPAGQLLTTFSGTYFTSDATISAKWTEGMTKLPKPAERKGYTFEGWYDSENNRVGSANDSFKVLEDTTLTAHWVEDPKLIYDGNSATGGSVADDTIAKGKKLDVAENAFTKTGYYFVNWNTKADGSGTSYAAKTSVIWNEELPENASDYKLFAQWSPNKLVKVQDIDNQPFTGEEITTEVVVIDDKGNVVNPSEYELSWEDNINVGLARVTVSPKADGNYAQSETISKPFSIVKAPYSQFKENKENYTNVYDGAEHFLKVSATTEDEAHAYKIGYGLSEQEAKENAEAQSEFATTNTGYAVKDVKDTGTVYYYIIPVNYEAYAGTLTANITPKEITISGLSALDREYDGTKDVTLSGTAVLDGAISGDDVQVDDTNAKAVASDKYAGTQNVTISDYALSGSDAENYTLAQPTGITFEITKKMVGFEWEDTTYTYDGTNKVYKGASIKGEDIIEDDTLTIGSYENNIEIDADTYTAKVVGLSGKDAANYSIDETTATHEWKIEKAENQITSLSIENWKYGKTANDPSATALYGEDTIAYLYKAEGSESWSETKPTNAGNYTVKAFVDETTNYGAAEKIFEFEIYKADITVIAKDAQSVRNQDLVSDIGYEISGELVESDRADIEVTVNTNANNTIAGKYTTSIANVVDNTNNYNIQTENGTYTVTRNDSTVNAIGYSETYDAQEHGISVTVNNDDAAVVFYTEGDFSDEISAKVQVVHDVYNGSDEEFAQAYNALKEALEADATLANVPTFKDAGTYTVEYIVLTDQSEPDVIIGKKDVVITKAQLTMTAKNHSITYGDELSDEGVEFEGFVGDESEEDLVGEATVTCPTYEQFSDAGTYVLLADTLEQTNYEITSKPGTLTVNPLAVELVWNEDEFTYDGSTKETRAVVFNALNGDDVKVAAYINNINSLIGEYTANATALGGSKAKNYTLEGGSELSHNWKIVNRDNNVTVSISDWTYGDTPNKPFVKADFNENNAVIEYFTKSGEVYTNLDGVPTEAGTYYVKATVPTDGYYFEGSSDYVEFNINKKDIHILIDNKASKHGNPLLVLTYQLSDNLVNGSDLGDITLSTTATKSSPAGDYEIDAEYTENANYNVTVTKGTYTITKAPMTATVNGYTGTYDGKAHGITVNLDPRVEDKAVIYYSTKALNESNFSTDGTTDPMDESVTRVDAGETTVYYYVDSHYYEGELSGSTTITISKKDLVVKANDAEITYGDEAKNEGVTYEGLLDGENLGEVKYTYGEYSVGSDVGTYEITPSGLNDTNYNIDYVDGQLTVVSRVVKFTWDNAEFNYNGEAQSPKATINNKVGSDDVEVDNYSGNVQTDVGSYVAEALTLKGDKADNYKISNTEASTTHNWKIVQVENTWEVDPSIESWTYGKEASEAKATPKFGDEVIFEYKKRSEEDRRYSTEVPTQVGEYTMRATVIRTDNYKQLSSTVDFEIKKAKITITAENQQSPYRSTLNELTSLVTGDYVEGDELGITLTTTATLLSPVGEYPITADWDKNPNYEATIVDGTYKIVKAHLSISHSDVTETYDGQPHGINVKIIQPSLHDATIWYSTTELTDENIHNPEVEKTDDPEDDSVSQTEVGEKVVYFYVESENFDTDPEDTTMSITGSNKVTVTKRPLSIEVNNQTITYGDMPNANKPEVAKDGISYTIPTGCVDDIELGNIHYNYAYEQYGDVGNYDITVQAESVTSHNYEISFSTGKLIVNKKPITFSWKDENDEEAFAYDYDGDDHHVNAIPQTLNGDVFEGTLTYENNNEHLVGSYTAKVVDIPTVGKAGNYILLVGEQTASQPWIINQATNEWVKAPIIDNWTYGEEPNTPSAEAKFGTGNIKYQYRSVADTEWSDEVPTQAGDYELKATIPETDNYKHLETTTSFKINKAKILVSADDLSSKYLEDILDATYTVEGREGDSYKDEDALDVVFYYDVQPTYHVGNYEIDLEATNATALNNYDIEYKAGTYTIEKAELVVEAKGYEGIYDGQEHGITVSVDHEEGSETAEVYYSLKDFAEMEELDLEALNTDVTGEECDRTLGLFSNELAETVLTESPVITTFNESPLKVYYLVISENYGLVSGSEEIIINKAHLEVKANDKDITYGDRVVDNGVTYEGFVNGEDETVLTGELAYDIAYAQYDDIKEEGFAITPKGLEAENYDIEFVDGLLTVKKYQLTRENMKLDPNEYSYDGKEKNPGIALSITNQDGDVYELVLGKDYEITGEASSKDTGTHTFGINSLGNFEGNFEDSWRITKEKETKEISEGLGKIIIETDIYTEDVNVGVEGLDREFVLAILTDEEYARVLDGETAFVYLEISDVEKPGEEDGTPLNKKFEQLGLTGCTYIDVKVYKKLGNEAAKEVHDTGDREITLIMNVPEEYHNNDASIIREFSLLRVHEGKVDVLDGPTTDTVLRGSSSKFSIYAIAYKDTEVKKEANHTDPTKPIVNTNDNNNSQLWLTIVLCSIAMFLATIGIKRKYS